MCVFQYRNFYRTSQVPRTIEMHSEQRVLLSHRANTVTSAQIVKLLFAGLYTRLDFRICPPLVTLHNGMNLIKLFPLK